MKTYPNSNVCDICGKRRGGGVIDHSACSAERKRRAIAEGKFKTRAPINRKSKTYSSDRKIDAFLKAINNKENT